MKIVKIYNYKNVEKDYRQFQCFIKYFNYININSIRQNEYYNYLICKNCNRILLDIVSNDRAKNNENS
jgi:hypothetical protein